MKHNNHIEFSELDFQQWCFACHDAHQNSIEGIWDLYLKGNHFRRQIFEHSPQSLQALMKAEMHLNQCIEKNVKELLHLIKPHFYEQKTRFESLCSRVETIPQSHLKEFYHDLHEFRFLKKLFAKVYGKEEQFENDLIHEIFNFAELEVFQNGLEHQELFQNFAELYQSALQKQILFFKKELELAYHLDREIEDEEKQRRELWGLWLWSGELAINISVSDLIYQSNLAQGFAELRKDVQLWLENDFKQMIQPEKNKILEDRSWSIYNQINDLMNQVDHSQLHFAQAKIKHIYEDTSWFLGLIREESIKKEEKSRLGTAYKKLYRLNQLVKAELQDKYLQGKLEKTFGIKTIKFFERTVFFLIFFVLFLLVIDYFFVAPENIVLRKTFAILDASACFVFLFEFFVKLAMVKEKAFYFKRRWFIDFLPSIPFVLLTDFFLLNNLYLANIGKLGQLNRYIRYINMLTPVIRVIRLLSFTLRGMDRLVRKYAKVLNQNLIFFESNQDIHRIPQGQAYLEAQRTYGICVEQISRHQNKLSTAQITPFAIYYLPQLKNLLDHEKEHKLKKPHFGLDKINELDIPVEQAIYHLLHLQGTQIESYLGHDFSLYLYKILGLVDVPILRNIPWVEKFLYKHKNSSPSEMSAWLVRNIAKLLELMMNVGYWFADLYGIISGPRLIDKVGTTLVSTFERPAKRLIMFGTIFALASLLAMSFDNEYIKHFIALIGKFLGIPAIAFGLICLIPLMLGNWLKGIAGEATELYRVTSEAQFINLLEDVKTNYTYEDLCFLYHRTLGMEYFIAGSHRKTQQNITQDHSHLISLSIPKLSVYEILLREHFIKNLTALLQIKHLPELKGFLERFEKDTNEVLQKIEHDLGLNEEQKEYLIWLENKIFFLYRDYLDGSILHHSDIKTTEQLLGNINMRNVLYYRMNLSKEERNHIEKVDLYNHRSIFGPYLWFSLITQSVNHNTAQLILDYNRFIIPQKGLRYATNTQKNLFDLWKDEKKNQHFNPQMARERQNPNYSFQTADFNSLSFLDQDQNIEKEIELKYGLDLLNILKEDRKLLIKGIFSSYPLHALPKPLRTINPYQLYQEYLFGSRIFILPFRLIGDAFSLIKMIFSWVFKKIHEIRHPEEITERPIPQDDFSVAVRKIDRMRKPIFFRMMHIRAKFDFEYLGISITGKEHIENLLSNDLSNQNLDAQDQATKTDTSHLSDKTENLFIFEEDLKYIHAIEYEQGDFYKLKEQRLDQIKECLLLLRSLNIVDDRYEIESFLDLHYPSFKNKSQQILRNLCIAYTIDYQRIMSFHQCTQAFTEALRRIQSMLNQGISEAEIQKNGIKELAIHKKVILNSARFADIILKVGKDLEKRGFQFIWQLLHSKDEFKDLGSKQQELLWKIYLAELREFKPILCEFAINPPEHQYRIFEQVINELDRWNEELLVVRILQSLSVLDIQNYRRHLWKIGQYDQDQ